MASSVNETQKAVRSYVVDAWKSRFQVKASASGMLSPFGHNPLISIPNFIGEAWFRPQTPEQSSLRIVIDAGAVEVANDISSKDRREMERVMKADVLETERYPEIRFEGAAARADQIADGMYRIAIAGTLTLHGAQRAVQVPCNVIVSDDSLRANGEFSIRQSDYGIGLVSVAGGTLKLKDELKLTFDVFAHRSWAVGTA